MHTSGSVIDELEDALKSGSSERRLEKLRKITDLFLSDADHLNDAQISVFDDVLCHLIKKIEAKAICELSSRLAPVENAPIETIRQLARNDEIAIAQPVLSQSKRLTNADLIDIARSKSQQHLLAIAGRQALEETVTDVLVSRGDRQVKHRLAANTGARFSESGFSSLVKSAEGDASLLERIGLRIDLPLQLLRELLSKATQAVRDRLLAIAPPEVRHSVEHALSKIASEVHHEVAAPRDFTAAVQLIEAMQQNHSLNEAALLKFATSGQYEETVAALAALCGCPVKLVAPLMKSVRFEGLLVACKSAGLSWPTVRALLEARVIGHTLTEAELTQPHQNYLILSQATAQRTLRFWKVRNSA